MRLRSVLASATVMLTIIAVNVGASPAAHAAPPGISITDVSVTETNGGTVSAVFALSYGGAPTSGVTVDYATDDGTATAGSDYVAASGTATLASTGCKCGTITIQVNGDTAFENNETFFVNLSNAVNKPLDDAQGIGTITNDDFPSASVDDPTVGEAAGTMTFTVSLDQAAPFDSVIGYSTAAGTATAGGDYTSASGNLTILSGATSGTVNVPVLDDALYEGDETLSLNLTPVSNVIIADAQGTGTITDDDPQPAITVDDPVAAENAGTMTFTISLDAAAGVPVSVDYATSDNTATAGQDYTATSGTATILAGSTTTTVDVSVLDDAVYEGDETLNLDLSGEVGGTLSNSQGHGTITEDDAAPAISVDSPAAGEADGTLTFTISIDAAAAVNTSVDYTTADGTADGADYTAQFGTATILAGSTSTTVDVPLLDDSVYEGDETLSLDLSNPVNGTGTPSGTGTITDDESAPAISVDAPSAAEGAGTLTFTVSIDAVSALDTSVDYATSDGTATTGADYTATSGTATILAGATSATVDVTVLDDSVYEGDETLSLDLSNPVNATGTPSGSGTITENDAAPTISIDDPTVGEAAGTMTFTISLDAAADVATSVEYDTANGTAAAGADYTAQSGTATILAGTTSTTVDVPILDDAVDEPDETLSLDLSNPGNGLGTPSGTGTITDDDAAPPSFDISIDDANVAEGNAGSHPLAFTVTLSAASGSDVSVDYDTANGTATAGSDYVAKSGTLVIPAGTTTKTVNVTVKGDTVWEPNETFTVTLSNQTDGTLLDPTGTGRITNDDKQPSALTVKARKTPTTVKARGLLEPASVGNKVVVTMAQRSHGRWHKVASKTVGVRKFADRDGDGKTDARYSAGFARAGRHGSLRFTVRFAGDGNTRPCSAKVRFRL